MGTKITEDTIQKYVAEYSVLFNSPVRQFTCPITLRQRPLETLCRGHVINKTFRKASRVKVIQWGPIDHFYGKIERTLVECLNVAGMTPQQILANCDCFVWLHDKTDHEAYWEGSRRGKALKGVGDVAALWYETPAGLKCFYVKGITTTDPRLDFSPILNRRLRIDPDIAAAVMVKAVYLTLFKMLGYKLLFNPCFQLIRRRLAAAYTAKAKDGDFGRFFGFFRDGFGLIGFLQSVTQSSPQPKPVLFNSLEHNQCVVIEDGTGLQFGLSFFYVINDTMITMTVPFCNEPDRLRLALRAYRRYIKDPRSIDHVASLNQYRDGKWHYEGNVGGTASKPPTAFDMIADGTWQFRYDPKGPYTRDGKPYQPPGMAGS